jgi:hypothetical protein
VENIMDRDWDMMSELEKMAALDMVESGYNYEDKADVNEYWTEIISTWKE